MKFGMRYGNPYGNVDAQNIYVNIPEDDPKSRTLSWTPEHSNGVYSHVVIDGVEFSVTDGTSIENFPQDARDHIEVIETSTQNLHEDVSNVASSASDTAKLEWDEVSGSSYYELYRALSPGGYGDTPIAVIQAGESSYAYYDRALPDDTYYYRVTAYDAAGNSQNSNEVSVEISAAPMPPSGLAISVT